MSLFVSFEGGEGSGKSTQVRLLGVELQRQGFDVVVTREPGGTGLGERVRDIMFAPTKPFPEPLTMAFLLAASRHELVRHVIRPALATGKIVLCDRYTDSTLVYQSYGQGLAREDMQTLIQFATEGTAPDVTVLVDVAPIVGLQRVRLRGDVNHVDAADLAFHERVRAGYLHMAQSEPGRWTVVDGDAAEDAVHCAILTSLEPLLAQVEIPT